MGLQSLPIIKFSEENLHHGSLWPSTCNKIRLALEEYGCFVAEFEKIPSKLHLYNDIFKDLKELFDLPTEIKMKNVSEKPYHGYIAGHQIPGIVPPLNESLGIEIDNGESFGAVDSFVKLFWPSGNDHLRENLISYSSLVSKMEQLIKRMIFESYGVEKYYESHINSTSYLIRTIKYRIPEMGEDNNVLKAHKDNTFITILHENGVNGLEVKTKNGDWLEVDISPNSFFVLAGEACLAWSNGRIYSAPHRVLIKGNKERYSLGLFSYHKGVVEIPNELVDENFPLSFNSFNHYGLLQYYFKNQGNKEDFTVKAYCGV